jgi:carboxyl-terminal processing protease
MNIRSWFVTFFVCMVFSLESMDSIAQSAPINPNAEKLSLLLNYIENMYVDSVNGDELVEKAIVHLLEELDPHSTYFTAEELKEANEPLQGSFDGIGVQFNILHDTIMVVEPIQGGPSEKLGIKAGDKIVEVEGVKMAGIGVKNNDVVSKLRGPRGTKVKVGIERKGVKEILHYEIIRDKIPIYSVDASYMIAPTIGYIKVSRFAATTVEEMKKGIADLKTQGMKDLILDLQDNGGGLLKAAFEMGDEFISGDKLLVYTEGRAFPREDYKARRGISGSFEKGRMIVLIDESSASASEIVSGAIQDWDRGLIVGRRSFGKGLVQRPFQLTDGSAVRLNSGEFFSADSIHFPDSLKYQTNITKRTVYGGGGIMPDIFVPLDTSENSRYFSDLLRTGVQSDWALTFVNAHREDLLKKMPTVEDFIRDFEISPSEMQKVIDMATEKKVVYDEKGFKNSEHAIRVRGKALVARNLYENESFFMVINELNPAARRAVEVLQNGEFEKFSLDPKNK